MNGLIRGTAPAITSREIAELVDSRHDSVKRTIERLVEAGVIVQPPLVDEPGTDAMGRPRLVRVYRFSGEQGKRDSIVVVAQLSPEFTARLVDRWMELEARAAAPALPNFNDPVAAARAWADAAERERQASEALAVAAPKAQALDRIAAADGSLSVTDAAKVLQAKPADLFGWLHVHGWIFRRGGKGAWRARQEKLDAGLLMHKAMVVTVAGRRAVRARRRLRRLRTVAPPLLDTAGERIRYARVTMGLSQAQFAAAVSRESGCRITKAAVSKWENNLTGLPQAENLLAAERVTGYPVDWLVRGGPEPERLGEVSDTDRLVEAVHVTPAGLAALAGLLGADVRQMALLMPP